MSFQNYEYQNQQDGAASAGAPATADTNMTGQADPSPAPFAGTPGEPSAAAPQQGGDGKTTLWYVLIPSQAYNYKDRLLT
jgi:hypothetical protein